MIGIFGGTFDPVHYGHIKPALSVKHSLRLEELRFVPNRVPPHREQPWLSTENRLALLRTALQGIEGVEIDERELRRDGPSYMLDTLLSLQDDFPGKSLCLIIGMDAFASINQWYQWRSLFDCGHLVVTRRPGFAFEKIFENMPVDDRMFIEQRIVSNSEAFAVQRQGKILIQSVPQLAISSTEIRDRLLTEESLFEWMPKQVFLQLRGLLNDH